MPGSPPSPLKFRPTPRILIFQAVRLFVAEGARVVIADVQDEAGEALAEEEG